VGYCEKHCPTQSPGQWHVAALWFSCAVRTLNSLGFWIQPPDAENRMSGGVAEVTGEIPSPRADRCFIVLKWVGKKAWPTLLWCFTKRGGKDCTFDFNTRSGSENVIVKFLIRNLIHHDVALADFQCIVDCIF